MPDSLLSQNSLSKGRLGGALLGDLVLLGIQLRDLVWVFAVAICHVRSFAGC